MPTLDLGQVSKPIPTKLSAYENDCNYVTDSELQELRDNVTLLNEFKIRVAEILDLSADGNIPELPGEILMEYPYVLNSIVYQIKKVGSYYVALYNGHYVNVVPFLAYSTDGKTWDYLKRAGVKITDLQYHEGYGYIGIGYQENIGQGLSFKCEDLGTKIFNIANNGNIPFFSMCRNQKTKSFLAIASDKRMFESTDGYIWTFKYSIGCPSNPYRMFYVNEKMFITGNSVPWVVYGDGGASWTTFNIAGLTSGLVMDFTYKNARYEVLIRMLNVPYGWQDTFKYVSIDLETWSIAFEE